jgi:ketosteroid isomerase-like protein
MDFAEEYRSLLDAYEAAVASGNPEAIGRLFSDDAIFLAPNQGALHGPTAVVSDYASSLGEGYSVKMEIEQMQDCGEYCFGSGRFEYDGGSGKWLHVLKRRPDRSLCIHRLCWN